MKEVVVWMLLSVSNGWDSQGVVTVVSYHSSLDKCISTEIQLKDDAFKRVRTKCVESTLLVPK
jgi:hypothetical protein